MSLRDEVLALIDEEINEEKGYVGPVEEVLKALREKIEKLFELGEKKQRSMDHPGKSCNAAHRGLDHDEWENRAKNLMAGFKEGREVSE